MPDNKLTHIDLFAGIPPGASVSPPSGAGSGRSVSLKKTSSVKKFSSCGSGLLPTPKGRDWKGQTQRGIHAPGDGLTNTLMALTSTQTSETLTEQDTGEQLCLPGGSLASRSAMPGSEEARMMTVSSGRKCYEQYGRLVPAGSLRRMSRALLASATA